MMKEEFYYGHRHRIKKKFLISEAKGMLDYELLELMLTFSIPRKDVKNFAKKLIKMFGSLSNVMDVNKNDLLKIKGLGIQSFILINLIKQMHIRCFENQIKKINVLSAPDQVIDFAKIKLGGLKNEVFMIIFLNIKNEVLDNSIIHEGTINQAILYPRRMIEESLSHNAAGIIIFHNHPSGHCYPSNEDKIITKKIKECLEAVDVQLLDHIIVTKGGYYSFQEEGSI